MLSFLAQFKSLLLCCAATRIRMNNQDETGSIFKVTGGKNMTNFTELFEDAQEPSEEKIADAMKIRTKLRRQVTLAYNQVLGHVYHLQPNVSELTALSKCDEWVTELSACDIILGSDEESDKFYRKIGTVSRSITDVANQAAAAPSNPSPQSGGTAAFPVQPAVQLNILLKPECQMTEFDGKFCSFREFESTFTHKYSMNPHYDDCDKFLALMNLLDEKSRSFISYLDPDAAGLAEAWRRLKEYYEKPTKIRSEIRTMWQKMRAVNNDLNIDSLFRVVLEAERSLFSLKNCNTSNEYINEEFFEMVTKKLPRNIVESYYENNSDDDIQKFLTFVKKAYC